MKVPALPENEKLRQNAVNQYQLLDTLPEQSYNEITALVSLITDAPISLITLLDQDRNFLKSHHGVPFNQSPRDISFCGHAIISDDPITIIEDARTDERFKDNPLVTEQNAVFYAGVPLVNPDGYRLGTLCVFDVKPNSLNEKQIQTIRVLANQVVSLFEQRLVNLELIKLQEELLLRNENLKKFANVVSHDLKSPLANITSLIDLVEKDLKNQLTSESLEYLEYLKGSSDSLREYIDGLLVFYMNSELVESSKELVSFKEFMEHIKKLCLTKGEEVVFNYTKNVGDVFINKSALSQILVNLITNAIKYNDKDKVVLDIVFSENDSDYIFEVNDNGPGISQDKLESIFELFSSFGEDRNNNKGTGIGLATVKKLIVNLGGQVEVKTSENGGASFVFNLKK